MHRPYSDDFELTYAVTGAALSATLIGFIWSMLPKRAFARPLLTGAVAGVGLLALEPLDPLAGVFGDATLAVCLQLPLTMATGAVLALRSYKLAVGSLCAQCVLFWISRYVKNADLDIVVLHQAWLGALLGLMTRLHADQRDVTGAAHPSTRPRLKALLPDFSIGVVSLLMGALVAWFVFDRLTYNGDEIAYVFQAKLFGHFRAYGTPPPCARMFENYWVFNYQGRLFSQYTPGWPLFMAPFMRLNLEWLAGPASLALLAVGVARLSRRLAAGFGATQGREQRIQTLAGYIGAATAVLGPAMLLNGSSRFPHTFVSVCFAWSVEAICAFPTATRASTKAFWLTILGLTTALGVAARPPDGGTLGVGVFLYFLYLLLRGRIAVKHLLIVSLAFAAAALPVAIILRLQLGEWFKTGYDVVKQFHGEGEVRLSWPQPEHWKFGIPLAWGAHMWWPAAPALGLLGVCRAVVGPARNAVFTLGASSLAMLLFYIHVEFSRVSDWGLGPRYLLPLVVPMAAGTGAALAPVLSTLGRALVGGRNPRFPGALVLVSALGGVCWIAPHVYRPLHAEFQFTTGPLRAAREQKLDNAVVFLFPKQLPADWWNLAQNDPTDPNPKVLFLTRHSAADEACVRQNYPGRTWYRAWRSDKLTPYP
jgi:hypothetical protein